MEDKAKNVWEQVKGAIGGLSKTIKGIIITGIVVVLVVIAVMLAVNSNKEDVVLFTDLTDENLTAVASYLNEQGIDDYRVEGNTVWVPEGQENKLRAGVIGGGYLQSGTGYSLYLQNVSALSTESDRAQLNLFQLNETMAATIRAFEGVQDAKVSVALGEDRRYVLSSDDTVEATASVVVTMKEDATLTPELAESFRAVVSHSVKGLVIENVDIRDSQGNTPEDRTESTATTAAMKRLELEEQINKEMKKQVMEVLEPMFGPGNVAVAVHATVEMSTSYSESTTYRQPAWADENADGRGIIGKELWTGKIVKGDDAAGGVVGTDPNSDLNTYVEEYTPDGTEDGLEVSGQKDYENDKTVTQSEQIGGYLKDVTVSVSINSEVANTATSAQLIAHVANAVGLTGADQDKISVLTHAFWKPESDSDNTQPAVTEPANNPFMDIPIWVYLALLAGLFLFMTLFLVFIMLGRRRNNRQQMQQLAPAADITAPVLEDILEPIAQPQPAGADIMDVHTEKSMELRRSVRDLADASPEIAAQAIRTLLRGDEESNA